MKYLLIAIALAGCNPYLTQQSVAPPGRSAHLDEIRGFWSVKHYTLSISEGVALAVTCEKGGPCHDVKIVSSDPEVAEVREASLSALESDVHPSGFGAQAPVSAFVVVGKAPGKTRVRLTSSEGERDVYVTVVAPPPTPNESRRAATAAE